MLSASHKFHSSFWMWEFHHYFHFLKLGYLLQLSGVYAAWWPGCDLESDLYYSLILKVCSLLPSMRLMNATWRGAQKHINNHVFAFPSSPFVFVT